MSFAGHRQKIAIANMLNCKSDTNTNLKGNILYGKVQLFMNPIRITIRRLTAELL